MKRDPFIERHVNRFGLKIDKDWSERMCKLYILEKFLDDSIYDNLSPFYNEYSGGINSSNTNTGTYVPLIRRRPSIIYSLPKIIVEESTSMLFGEEHFPVVRDNEHEETTQLLQYVTRISDLKSTMIEAARIGSIGSVAIAIKVLEGKFFFEVLNTQFLTPVFDIKNPEILSNLKQCFKLDGASLIALGYDVTEDKKNHYFYLRREWTDTEEIFYLPVEIDNLNENKTSEMTKDETRSYSHDLGFLPAIWIKNLPKSGYIDGHSTFECILDISTEINYQLSQLGRGLKYNSDPTLVIKNPTGLEDEKIIKGIGALNLDEKGDAYLLEIKNSATKSVLDYASMLRQLALESVRGNRANPDKVSGLHSGKALQMLNSSLISLVEELRISYGEKGLLNIYAMILDFFHSKVDIKLPLDVSIPTEKDCKEHLTLEWPDWYAPTPQDTLQQAQAITTLKSNGVISTDTAIKSVADEYHILDPEEEKTSIESDQEHEYTMNIKTNSVDRNKSSDVDRN